MIVLMFTSIELSMKVEAAFDITIPSDEFEKMETVGLIVDYLYGVLNPK